MMTTMNLKILLISIRDIRPRRA